MCSGRHRRRVQEARDPTSAVRQHLANTGHHHLLIDIALSPDELKQPIAMDDKHRHFGGGQTESMLTLPPGQHTLQLELADWSHVPFNPPIASPIITLTVK
jgi:Domain of unknown function (DUF4399)